MNNSLYLDGLNAGLSDNLIMEMANIFGGVIDFVYDPRQGDTFSVLYEEQYLEGDLLGEGEILAASYTNSGKIYTAHYITPLVATANLQGTVMATI